jgi:hypothetical protein
MRTPFAAAALLLVCCTDALPCSNCPQIQGTYGLTWVNGTGCVVGPQPSLLTLTQSGSAVSANVGGTMLQGTLYDTFDFTMSGLSGDTQTRFEFKAVAVTNQVVGPAADGGLADGGVLTSTGVHLIGSLRTLVQDGGCNPTDKFTGDRLAP